MWIGKDILRKKMFCAFYEFNMRVHKCRVEKLICKMRTDRAHITTTKVHRTFCTALFLLRLFCYRRHLPNNFLMYSFYSANVSYTNIGCVYFEVKKIDTNKKKLLQKRLAQVLRVKTSAIAIIHISLGLWFFI